MSKISEEQKGLERVVNIFGVEIFIADSGLPCGDPKAGCLVAFNSADGELPYFYRMAPPHEYYDSFRNLLSLKKGEYKLVLDEKNDFPYRKKTTPLEIQEIIPIQLTEENVDTITATVFGVDIMEIAKYRQNESSAEGC